jgi:Fic family protein
MPRNSATRSGNRAGRYVRQTEGHSAFLPAALPPAPPIAYSGHLATLLSRADIAIGRLDGETRNVPNPDLFVAMYVRREAVLSSQIEGTESTLEDLLAIELEPRPTFANDVDEIVNYVAAMNYGLDRLADLPLSLRLIREIHAELLRGVRGAGKQPGEFRRQQNFIAPAGARSIEDATFVPPPVPQMKEALHDFELFLHREDDLPVLVHVGVAHAQFETIHPFMDGNGRVGRLLVTFLLMHRGVLHRPLLYLSLFLKRNREEYYDRLMAIRDEGDWEGWIEFFLRGVAETAEDATTKARAIVELRAQHLERIDQAGLPANARRLLDLLYRRPLVDVPLVRDELGVAFGTANKLMEQLESARIVREVTGRRRDRVFRFDAYLGFFASDEDDPLDAVTVQETEPVR